MKKENVYVLCDTESKLEQLKNIVDKIGDTVQDERIDTEMGYLYFKYSSNCGYWWVGKKPSEKDNMKEMSIQDFDEFLNKPQNYIARKIISRMKKIIPHSSGITVGKYKSLQGIIRLEIEDFFELNPDKNNQP